MIEQISRAQFIERMGENADAQIKSLVTYQFPDAMAVVLAEIRLLDSVRRGERQAMIVGPRNTYKTVAECEGKWIPTGTVCRFDFVAFCLAEEYRR